MTTLVQPPGGAGYEGLPSFSRWPICFDLSALEADVALAGACVDGGTTHRPGTRFGPRAIREGSTFYAVDYSFEDGYYDIETGQNLLAGLRLVDCGDITTLPTLVEKTNDNITAFTAAIRKRGALPLILGGDHSISYPVVRAIDDRPLHVVQFDTHLDLMDDDRGIRLSHANPLKRISELENVTGITHIGIRGLTNSPAFFDPAQSPKSTIVTAEQVRTRGTAWTADQVPQSENIYLTLDIDALDPAEAPGTGTPEFGGLTYLQMRDLLRLIGPKGRLVGMDLVEVNPLYDPSQRTGQIAARLIIDALGAALSGR